MLALTPSDIRNVPCRIPEAADGPVFFHIKDGARLVRDQEGTDLAGPDHARAHALQSARELCANAIKAGRDLDADALVVADAQGQSLTFVPVVEVLPKRLRDRQR